jgi:uncharacterized repeat protein (TIGR03803 family)
MKIVDPLDKLRWWKSAYTVVALCAATATGLPAQTLTTLYGFCGAAPCPQGRYASGALVQGTDGYGYGTTGLGGANPAPGGSGGGTVFKISPNGTLTTLYSFCSQSGCTDGEYPLGGLVQASAGDHDFYGTTAGGGANPCSPPLAFSGCGTIFKISPSGTLATLYSFCAEGSYPNCADGYVPNGLVQAANGDLYGTTTYGGASYLCTGPDHLLLGCGTVFKITPSGTLTTLYSFCSQIGCADGEFPNGGLIQAGNGDLYGTTADGGSGSLCTNLETTGCGTVFKITPSGTLTTLYSFCSQSGCPDGWSPAAGLVQATNGDLYGTTDLGGNCGFQSGCGTVFKITPAGTLTTLYSFCSGSDGNCPDGGLPDAPLIQASSGDLYGITTHYGAENCESFCGTIFKITPSGTLTTVHQFCRQRYCPNGGEPLWALVQATNGDFYGTTYFGGVNGGGTVFSLSVGLGPFVKTLTPSGEAGAAVTILGSDLSGATSVTFNGAAATFTVNSTGTAIETAVPTGASSGPVRVVTPAGALSSKPFQVLP